jgi:uncharacterized protein YjbI with pentapeptide repeats
MRESPKRRSVVNLLELLEAGKVEEFNASRGVRRPPDLFAADLSNKNLRGANLSNANLEKADLSGSDLTGAILEKCNLSGADLTGAKLVGVQGIKIRCKETWFEDVSFEDSDFTGGDFREAVLNGAHAAGTIFNAVRFSGAEITNADLRGADLTEARLANADFSGTKLDSAVFLNAKMAETEFTRASLKSADLTGVRGNGAKLNHVDLSGAVLREADLTEADFGGSNLTGADLTRADLGGASLEGANLNQAIFVHASLESVEFSEEQRSVIITESAGEDTSVAEEIVFTDLRADSVEGTVGLTWENETEAGQLSLRAAVFGTNGKVEAGSVKLPVPMEMVLAHGMAATTEGYVALCFLERPSGMTLMVSEVSPFGDLGGTRSLEFDYRPAVSPVIVSDGDGVLIYGLSRRGPTLFVHRYSASGLERLWGEPCPTARGFVGENPPLLVTKGGTLVPVGKDGLGKPVNCPDGFPGRHAACKLTESGVFVAWIRSGGLGFFCAELEPGVRPEVDHLAPKSEISQLELLSIDGEVTAFYTTEQGGKMSAVACYGMQLPFGKPFPVLVRDDEDVERVLPIQSQDGVRVVCQTIDDKVVVVKLKGEKASKWGDFPTR